MRLDGDVESAYRAAVRRIDEIVDRLGAGAPPVPADQPAPSQGSAPLRSNMQREAYVSDIKRISDYIVAGDIIQCVYSQRFSRETFVHPVQRLSHAAHREPVAVHLLP